MDTISDIGSGLDDAVHDVVDFVGDVGTSVGQGLEDAIEGIGDSLEDAVEWVGDRLEDVVESIEKNPMILVAAVGAYFAIQGIMTSMASAGTLSPSAIVGQAGVDAIMLEMPTASIATATGESVLAATGSAVAEGTAANIAAASSLEAGATLAEATSISNAVSSGSGLIDSVTQYASSIVDKMNPFTVAADATTSTSVASQNVFSQIGSFTNKVYTTIGETLLPDASAGIQKFVGQGTFNTAINGGDIESGIKSTAFTFGLENVGNIADTTFKSLGEATDYFTNVTKDAYTSVVDSFKTATGASPTDFSSQFGSSSLMAPTSNISTNLGSIDDLGSLASNAPTGETLSALDTAGKLGSPMSNLTPPPVENNLYSLASKTPAATYSSSPNSMYNLSTGPIDQNLSPTNTVSKMGSGLVSPPSPASSSMYNINSGPISNYIPKAIPPGFFSPETKANIEGLTAGAKLATAGYGVATMAGLIGPDSSDAGKKTKQKYDYTGLGGAGAAVEGTKGTTGTTPTKASYANAPIKGFHMVKVKNQSGNTLYVPFIGDKALNPIPSGYKPI